MVEHLPLNVTQKSKHRIFVGLGWDPNDEPTLKDKVGAFVGQRDIHHDLDLSCYYFNKDGACLGYVNAEPQNGSNPSGSIYHSGDSVEGVGDGDDEQISVELLNLPPNIHHLIFKASIKSGQVFDEIAAAEMRLCDGYTERAFLDVTLDKGGKRDAFIFVHIYRAPDTEPTDCEWLLHNISTFAQNIDAESWKETLSSYL